MALLKEEEEEEAAARRRALQQQHPALQPTSIRGRKTSVRWTLSLARFWLCCLWVLIAAPDGTCADSNGCDFYGSGLEQDGRGVQPVYLGCSSGRVEWQYPRAGLRVIFRSPKEGRDFRACIRGDASFEGARVYLEGHRSLLPVFAADDGRPRELSRCFTSYRGQAALYVEAEAAASASAPDRLRKQVAAFEYDLQTLSKGAIYDPLEECRPCSEEELLHLYCSADFVAKGTIVRVTDDPRLSRTTIVIRATKLFQQTSPVFRHASASGRRSKTQKQKKEEEKEEEEEVEEEEEEELSNLVADGGYVGRVEVPLQCGAKAGEGEFLVMGVMRLGQPILRCAPRHEEWRTLAQRARSRVQCVLET